jgi:hypothetical protein
MVLFHNLFRRTIYLNSIFPRLPEERYHCRPRWFLERRGDRFLRRGGDRGGPDGGQLCDQFRRHLYLWGAAICRYQ